MLFMPFYEYSLVNICVCFSSYFPLSMTEYRHLVKTRHPLAYINIDLTRPYNSQTHLRLYIHEANLFVYNFWKLFM